MAACHGAVENSPEMATGFSGAQKGEIFVEKEMAAPGKLTRWSWQLVTAS
jgi:hypothetical protein